MNATYIIIVFLSILVLWMLNSKSFNSQANWGAGLIALIAITTLTILSITETTVWLLNSEVSFVSKLLIWTISIPIVIYFIKRFFSWKFTINNLVYIPTDYNKNSVLIIYNQNSGKLIRSNISPTRRIILNFNNSGILKVKNSRNSLLVTHKPIEVRYKSGRKFKEYEHTQTLVKNITIDKYRCGLIILNTLNKSSVNLNEFTNENVIRHLNK